ncbi:MAG: hypothetical protein ACREB9_01725 [Thermoplasmata archaeon]
MGTIPVENTGKLPWVEEGDFLVGVVGGTSGQKVQSVPFKVRKRVRFAFAYDFVEYVPNFLPLAPVGIAGIPGLAQSFLVQNIQLQVQTVNNVQNLFTIQNKNYEAYQLFVGVRPSPLRVYPQQPVTAPTTSMDQNLILGTTFYDEGWYDGWDSPYEGATDVSEMLSLSGAEPSFSILNPTSTIIEDPGFLLYLQRMNLQAITDPKFAADVASGRVPRTRFISMGDPLNVTNVTLSNYPGAQYVTATPPGSAAAGSS